MLASSSRNVWCSSTKDGVSTCASAAGLVPLGIRGLRVGRRAAASGQDEARHLAQLLVVEDAVRAVRQHAARRVAGPDAGDDLADRAAVQPEIVGEVRPDQPAEVGTMAGRA